MSTTNSDKIVSIIQPSETLAPLLQNAAAETRPAAIALQTRRAMTLFQSSGPSLVMMLRYFADTSSKVALVARTSNGNLTENGKVDG
jgi:hypothetical protein